jgi:hypothetical protein
VRFVGLACLVAAVAALAQNPKTDYQKSPCIAEQSAVCGLFAFYEAYTLNEPTGLTND